MLEWEKVHTIHTDKPTASFKPAYDADVKMCQTNLAANAGLMHSRLLTNTRMLSSIPYLAVNARMRKSAHQLHWQAHC